MCSGVFLTKTFLILNFKFIFISKTSYWAMKLHYIKYVFKIEKISQIFAIFVIVITNTSPSHL